MRQSHSYEEPAFDLYPLQADPSRHGAGRIGQLRTPTTLTNFSATVKTALNAKHVQTVGDPSRSIQKVALACGAAGEFLGDAARHGADVFLTGELRFHDALAAESRGLAVVVPGHYATERPGVEDLAERIAKELPNGTVWASRDERDPLG